VNWVTPKYFETFGTRFLAGRDFAFDDQGRARVAIVNQAAATYYFGDGSAIGHRFTLEGQSHSYEIVGVVADAKYMTLHEPAPRTLYLNVIQEPRMFANRFSIRTTTPPASVAADVRRVTGEMFEPAAVASITTLEDQVDAEIVAERVVAMLSALFGALGAALAGLGLYGLLAYTVTRRTNEIGVRIALGARPVTVIAMVLKSAVALVIGGLIVGIPIAVAGRRLVGGLVASVPEDSAIPIGAAVAMMIVIALFSAFVPARRAAMVDPMIALRQD
jgi:hypothetical protein